MWQLLLATAIAASTGLATKLLLTLLNNNNNATHNININNPNANANAVASSHDEESDDSGTDHVTRVGNRVFVFNNTSESLRHGGPHYRSTLSENGPSVRAPIVEHRGNRLQPFCSDNTITDTNTVFFPSSSSSKDNSFSTGLGFGIMYMMLAEKAEISKLTRTMKEIAISVQELKSELNIKKSSHVHQIWDPNGNIDTNSGKMSGKHYEVMLKKTNSELRNPNAKIWSPINDGGECGSSALTEEPEPRVLELDQLEAELEFELQKLSGCAVDSPGHELRPTLHELGVPDEACYGIDDPNFIYSQSPAVLASELNEKLSPLLIKQQEKQIVELESELHRAQSNLQQKEAELHALKDYVKRLTELSLSAVSDDETQVLNDCKGSSDSDNNNMDSFSKQSVVGAKRPFDSESCSYCLFNDCDLCEHTIIQGFKFGSATVTDADMLRLR